MLPLLVFLLINISTELWAGTLPSVTAPPRGQLSGEDRRELPVTVLLASPNSTPSSHPLPKPPVSLDTAVENNSIRHIFIDNLNTDNINNITELLENRKRKKPPRSPMTLTKPPLLVLG